MKKSLLALAVMSAFAGAASAQSSVTLSGAVDLGLRYSNDVWTMRGAGSSRTNFTLSGTEDLGGGMRVFFLANHRFNLATGAQTEANAFWRQGWVGVGGGFGDLRLGKILPPLQDFNGQFEPWGGGDTVGSTHTTGLFAGNSNLGARYANSIYYRSPSLGGLVAHAMIAAADNNFETFPASSGAALPPGGAERPMGFGVIYGAGPLRLAAAYDSNANEWTTQGLYGSFNAGFATFMAQFETGEYNNAGNDVSRWSIGATVPFGAALLKFGYTDWKDEDTSKFGIGLDYNLSKRTQLYTNIGDLSGNGKIGTPATPTALWTNNQKKTQFDFGIFHRF